MYHVLQLPVTTILFLTSREIHFNKSIIFLTKTYNHPANTTVYPKVSELAAWNENCKWYSSLPLGAVVKKKAKVVPVL
jgi:hypothetical protein